MAGRANIAIERVLASKDRSDIRGNDYLACKVLRVVESLLLVNVLDRFLINELVSRLYPKQEDKKQNNNQSMCNAQAT